MELNGWCRIPSFTDKHRLLQPSSGWVRHLMEGGVYLNVTSNRINTIFEDNSLEKDVLCFFQTWQKCQPHIGHSKTAIKGRDQCACFRSV